MAPENISEIRRVLGECTANCHPWEPSSLPTRLIDVGTSVSDTPRLVLLSGTLVAEETKYAALSYCWGNKDDAKAQLKTEKSTLEERLQGIAFDTMTPATRDAIELTRAFGLRYIWIDALCIIQDDAADWSYESGQMDRVYQDAFVTFCALVSESCQESFVQRCAAVTVPFQSAIRPSINGDLLVRLEPREGDWPKQKPIDIDRDLSSWDKRAWTYQEERLSTRMVFFGASKVHFQCGTHQWSEGDDRLRRLEDSAISLHDRMAGIERGEYPATSLYDHWNTLVYGYAHRSITKETDRLPAMSGLARLVGGILGDEYLAGLWKGNILTGLAWSSTPMTYGLQTHLQGIREGEYIAPSWSWAGCSGGGLSPDNAGRQTVPECTLLDVNVESDLHNPFGMVYGGYILICGKVAPIPPSLREGGRSGNDPAKWELKLEGGLDDITAHLDWCKQQEEEGLENLVMLLLHTQHPSEPSNNSGRERVCRALMLYPTETPGKYYRVGVVHSWGEAAYDMMKAWFEEKTNEKICTII